MWDTAVGLDCNWNGGMKNIYIILERNILQNLWLKRLTKLQDSITDDPTKKMDLGVGGGKNWPWVFCSV
jgi:hypothetical protein